MPTPTPTDTDAGSGTEADIAGLSDIVEKHYKTRDVAKLFDVSRDTVVRWINDNELRAVRRRNYWLVPESSIKEFAADKYGHVK